MLFATDSSNRGRLDRVWNDPPVALGPAGSDVISTKSDRFFCRKPSKVLEMKDGKLNVITLVEANSIAVRFATGNIESTTDHFRAALYEREPR